MKPTPLNALRMVAMEFANVSDSMVQEWIDLCAPLVSRKQFDKLYEHALALLTAHRMKMAGVGGSSDDDPLGDIGGIDVGNLMRVSNFSEGQTSIGLNGNTAMYAGKDAELTLTKYGVQYLSLRKARILPIVSAGE